MVPVILLNNNDNSSVVYVTTSDSLLTLVVRFHLHASIDPFAVRHDVTPPLSCSFPLFLNWLPEVWVNIFLNVKMFLKMWKGSCLTSIEK